MTEELPFVDLEAAPDDETELPLCQFCNVGEAIHEFRTASQRNTGADGVKLCEICYSTDAGNIAAYPRIQDLVVTTLARLMVQLEWARRTHDEEMRDA